MAAVASPAHFSPVNHFCVNSVAFFDNLLELSTFVAYALQALRAPGACHSHGNCIFIDFLWGRPRGRASTSKKSTLHPITGSWIFFCARLRAARSCAQPLPPVVIPWCRQPGQTGRLQRSMKRATWPGRPTSCHRHSLGQFQVLRWHCECPDERHRHENRPRHQHFRAYRRAARHSCRAAVSRFRRAIGSCRSSTASCRRSSMPSPRRTGTSPIIIRSPARIPAASLTKRSNCRMARKSCGPITASPAAPRR